MKLVLSGEIDVVERDDLTALLTAAAQEARAEGRPLVVDLGAVTFMDSTGISCLIAASNHLASPTDLHLVNVPRNVFRLLEITGLADLCKD